MLRLLLVAALLVQGCGVRPQGILAPRYSLSPESEAWRDPAPINLPLPYMEHCLTNGDGETTCQCINPYGDMKPIRCYDEV